MFLELESHEKLIGTKAKSSQKEEIRYNNLMRA